MECPICNNKDFIKVKLMKEVSRVNGRAYSLFKCENCGLVRPEPQPYEDKNKLNIYDNTENIRFFDSKNNKIEYTSKEYIFYFDYFKTFLEFIDKYKIKGKALDIGCGAGHLLELMSNKGLKAEGMKITKKLVTSLNKRYNVYLAEVGDKKMEGKKYDLLTLNQVVEHISNPIKFVQDLNKLLKLNGYVIMATPYLNGLVPQILRTKWYGLGHGQHLNFFSKKSFKILLEKNGFEICEFKVLIVNYDHQKFPRFINLMAKTLSSLIVSLNMGDNLFVVAKKIKGDKK